MTYILGGVGHCFAWIVYIIICGHICSVDTTSKYCALTLAFGILTAPHTWEGGCVFKQNKAHIVGTHDVEQAATVSLSVVHNGRQQCGKSLNINMQTAI